MSFILVSRRQYWFCSDDRSEHCDHNRFCYIQGKRECNCGREQSDHAHRFDPILAIEFNNHSDVHLHANGHCCVCIRAGNNNRNLKKIK